VVPSRRGRSIAPRAIENSTVAQAAKRQSYLQNSLAPIMEGERGGVG